MKPTDFIVEHNPFIAQDAEEMHGDHEVQMARADCYNAADYAIKLHKILQGVKETGQLEGWVSEKITLANDYLRTVYEYLSYEQIEQEKSAMPAFAFESAENTFNQLVSEGGPYDLPGKDYDRPDDTPRKPKPNDDDHNPYPFSPEEDDDYFRNIFRKKREAAAKDQGVTESADGGSTGAASFATGPVADAAPMQSRVKKESAATKKYSNAMQTKQPKIGKGVY